NTIIAIGVAADTAQIGNEASKSRLKPLDEAGLNRLDQPRLFAIRQGKSGKLTAKVGKDRAVVRSWLEGSAPDQFFAVSNDERNRKGGRHDPLCGLLFEPADNRSEIGPHRVQARCISF